MFLSNFLQKVAFYILDKTGYKKQSNEIIIDDINNNDNYKRVPISKINIINKKKNLIDKNIYFINVGDIEPYMDLCIESYKNYNSDYKIDFINYTYDDFFKQKNVWNICKKYSFDKLDKLSLDQLNKVLMDYKFQFIYQYGGILCSLKSFCVRNLDDCLNNTNFIYTSIQNNSVIENKSMIGIQQGYMDKINNRLYPPCNMDCLDYESIKLAFYKLRLRIDNFQTNNKLLQNYIWSF